MGEGRAAPFCLWHPIPQARLARYPEGTLQRGVPLGGKEQWGEWPDSPVLWSTIHKTSCFHFSHPESGKSLDLQRQLAIWWLRWYRVRLQCRRPGFNVWIGNVPGRRKWQSTPVFLPGKSHGWRSLAGYSPRVAKSRTQLSDLTHRETHTDS